MDDQTNEPAGVTATGPAAGTSNGPSTGGSTDSSTGSTGSSTGVEVLETGARGTAGRKAILEVDQLQMYFPVKSSGLLRRTIGHVQAVDGVSF
jgi:ABC-type glutathione transport system ATPase component